MTNSISYWLLDLANGLTECLINELMNEHIASCDTETKRSLRSVTVLKTRTNLKEKPVRASFMIIVGRHNGHSVPHHIQIGTMSPALPLL